MTELFGSPPLLLQQLKACGSRRGDAHIRFTRGAAVRKKNVCFVLPAQWVQRSTADAAVDVCVTPLEFDW